MVAEQNTMPGRRAASTCSCRWRTRSRSLIQFVAFDLGATIAYWSRDPKKIIPNLVEVRPTYFPSVPRIFEKIYTMATATWPRTGSSSTRRSSWA